MSFDLRLLITHLVSSNFALIIILSVLLWFTASDYPFSFFKLCFGHCIVCPSLIYGLWLHIWYLQTLFWSLYCLSFFDLRLLITHLVSSNFVLVIVLSVLLRFTASDYPFGIQNVFKFFLFILVLITKTIVVYYLTMLNCMRNIDVWGKIWGFNTWLYTFAYKIKRA